MVVSSKIVRTNVSYVALSNMNLLICFKKLPQKNCIKTIRFITLLEAEITNKRKQWPYEFHGRLLTKN